MRTLLRRLNYLFNRRRFDQELANDLEFHREMSGIAGNLALGNTLRLREEARDEWGWTWIDRLWQDLHYAARVLRKSPAFAASAIVMLAIGIGVNVAVFGFFSLVVLRPINVREPSSLVRFHRRGVEQYAFALPYPEAEFFRRHSRTLSAAIEVNQTKVSIEGEDRPVSGSFVTANFFHELGGSSGLGTVLDPVRDESPGASPVVVLGHGFWQRHFGGNPSIVGQTIRINGKAATIIGVAARDFGGVGSGLQEPALWAPITQQPYFVSASPLLTDFSIESPGVSFWGRIAPGGSAKAAEDELASLAAGLHRQHPIDIWEHERLLGEPGAYLTSMIIGNRRGTGTEQRDPIYAVFGLAATLTLLILAVACGNLGSMLLARGVARQREIAIRVAIGAGNGRLIRQLFTESLLVALVGSAVGLALGAVVLQILLAAAGAPAWMHATPDWRLAAFSLAMGFAAAVLFGLTPALQVGRERYNAQIARRILIGAQVAASCVLLIVTGLLVRALDRAAFSSPGFDYERVVSISPGLSDSGYTPARAQQYFSTLEERLRAIPGVQSVSLALSPPLGQVTITVGTEINGHHVVFQRNDVSPGFFETMRIPLQRGRDLRPNERAVVISEAMARQGWPDADPLGKSFVLDDSFTVVGVVGSLRSMRFGDSDTVQAYFPLQAANWPSLAALVRTAGSPKDLARYALAAGQALDPNTRPRVESLANAFQTNLHDAQQSTLAVSVLGMAAQFLACFGIVGVVSYAISQRTKEIGIRMTLGARPAQILTVVLRQLVFPVGSGLVAGVAGGAALSQVLRGRLYGLSNLDPGAYMVAIGVFVVTAAIAAAIPAQRALRIDPLRALHHE
jgi:predicted permease